MNQEEEKKEYTRPEMEVIAFTQQANVLTESCQGPEYLCGDGTE